MHSRDTNARNTRSQTFISVLCSIQYIGVLNNNFIYKLNIFFTIVDGTYQHYLVMQGNISQANRIKLACDLSAAKMGKQP